MNDSEMLFEYYTEENLHTLYSRSLLEYASVVWSPRYKTDVDLLEKLEKRCLALCNEPPVLESL